MKPLSADHKLKISQISRICQTDPRTVKKWVKAGLLAATYLPASTICRINAADFAKFLTQHHMPVPHQLSHLVRTRFLIVDDDDVNVRIIRHILSDRFPQSEVQEAKDGFEAGILIGQANPQLVILDLRMPRMDGYKVCRLIRSNPDTRSIRILIVSGLSIGECEKAVQLGADAYLTKPFNAEDLVQKVTALLGKKVTYG